MPQLDKINRLAEPPAALRGGNRVRSEAIARWPAMPGVVGVLGLATRWKV